METTAQFSINVVGNETGNPYSGTFKVKTALTRRDRFVADQKRRDILGPGSEVALAGLQTEAFMIAQLSVRIIESPKWWQESSNGLDLQDGNVIVELFNKVIEEEEKRLKELKESAQSALEQLTKK